MADVLERELAGLDHLDAAPPATTARSHRWWTAIWPKLVAVGVVLAIWQILVWREWRPDYAFASPSDVFARLWVRRAEWIVRTSVRSYLFGATRNGALNLRKRQAVEEDWAAASAASDPSERPDTPRRPDEVMESADAEERVRVALETLPERCRLVMQLRWRDQLSYAEIAEVMDISVKGVENQLARGLKSLRDKL